MKKLIMSTVIGVSLLAGGVSHATPEQDQEAFQNFFTKRFKNTPKEDFINGVYSIDAPSREQWEQIEEFPPYELAIEEGETMYNTPFANGKSYADCFGDDVSAIRARYPMFDSDRGEVVTLELAINECRAANGEEKLKWAKGPIASVSAYIAYEGRDATINVEIPNDAALAAYEAGKELYYTRKGQLNFACASCHMYGAGMKARADLMSPSFGHTSGFPVYRSKWGAMGTLHRRFKGCLENIRAKPFKPQSAEFRNLEYFMSYMNNGLALNGPSARK